MRVLLVNDYPTGLEGSGGVEMHIPQLQKALAEQGVQTAQLTHQLRGYSEILEKDRFLIPDFSAPPLRKHFLRNVRQHQAALKKAAEVIHRFKPDVIHVHNLMNPGALRMLRQCGPVVKSIHDCRPFCVKPYPAVASRLVGYSEEFCDISFGMCCWPRCYARSGHSIKDRIDAWSYFPANLRALHEIMQADQLVVYSQYLKDLALRKMTDAERIHIVYHFTEAEFASENLLPEAEGDPVFLFAGRLSAEKGVLQIFDALERMPNIPCRLIIAGDGPLRDEVLRRSQICRPLHKVEVRGFLDQPTLYELYRRVSVLLFPSIGSEGCPLTGIEAMYFGVPAIGYDTGGVGEWLINRQTGFLLSRGDIKGMAGAMTELASDPGQRARMGKQAREFVSSKFRRKTHIHELIRIYELALQHDRRAQRKFSV
jgi:glycosyltransferase involved in cell wall biosynthesis